MQSPLKILLSVGLGAATMYYLDPARGRHRRALTRARLEHGRESVTHGVHKAGHGLNTARYRARVVGRKLSRGTDKARHGVRTLGHNVGYTADQVTHGARAVSHEARERAAGVAATLASLFRRRRHEDDALDVETGSASRGRLLLIPVTSLVTIGVGAAAMYFLDPSQGIYRRSRVRARFARWRAMAGRRAGLGGHDRTREQKESQDADAEDLTAQSRPGNGSDRRRQAEGRPLEG